MMPLDTAVLSSSLLEIWRMEGCVGYQHGCRRRVLLFLWVVCTCVLLHVTKIHMYVSPKKFICEHVVHDRVHTM